MAYITSKKPEMWQCQKKWLIIVRYRKEFQHHIYTHEPSKLAWIKRFEVYWAQDLLLYSIITTTICGFTSFCKLRMKSRLFYYKLNFNINFLTATVFLQCNLPSYEYTNIFRTSWNKNIEDIFILHHLRLNKT